MRIVLTGPPGAGKGTQAQLLAEAMNIAHISTGDLFRHHIAENTELGRTAKSYIDAGELVPSDITVAMVRNRLTNDDVAAGFILDGFPRTVDQATALDGILSELNIELDAVLDFSISEDSVVERMLVRGRADDTEDVIRTRLRVYNGENAPLLQYYSEIVCRLNADGTVEEVHTRAVDAIKRHSNVGARQL